MGWGGGIGLLIGTWEEVRSFVPKKKRAEILAKVIELFEDQDMDEAYILEEEEWEEVREALELAGHDFEDEEDEDED